MRNLIVFVTLSIFFISCQNNSQKQKPTGSNNEEMNNIPSPVEEMPNLYPEKNVTMDIGKVIFDSNSGLPKTSNKTTPLKSLAKLAKANPNCNEITILYNKFFSSGDYAKDMKIIYNRTEKKVTEIGISSNIKDIYDNVTDDVISAAANDKECPTLYCLTSYSKTSIKTDFSERKIDAIGPQPKQDTNNYSVEEVVKYLNNENIYTKIKFLEWSKVSNIGADWIVRAKYKATLNGIEITDDSWYYIQNNIVVRTKKIE